MAPIHTLRAPPLKDDDSWKFSVPASALVAPIRKRNNAVLIGKLVRFSKDAITLEINTFPNNRILRNDDPGQFILVSFDIFRFADCGPSVTRDYISRLMKNGFWINGLQYRFYHHSNSQLRGRSCFMRHADTDQELDTRIYAMGSFGSIMNVAKRAKRIGLLFSEASIDYQLNPSKVEDIPDIKSDDTLFSDGCGLISPQLAVWVSKAKRIIFRGTRYTPCVFQIRYLGYKGVLMLHPQLKDAEPLAQFRASMKKFSQVQDNTFSIIEVSRPFSFGRLNNDIIVLLSSLGITTDAFLAKQRAYLTWITNASSSINEGIDFLSCLGEDKLVERVLLEGFDDPSVQKAIREQQLKEVTGFRNPKNANKPRVRMMIHQSRLLFGVCDPYQVLKEGEVHVKVTTGRGGASAIIHGDVLVVRNPCLHPGDCLKLRAVYKKELSHLADCIVFAAQAKPGHQAAPAMSSGGDLDGDKYFVCWDKDIVPSRVFQSYDYPPNKEPANRNVTRQDLALHFAAYNAIGVAKVSALHQAWVKASSKGAASPECQELNALHSQCVDGARVKIPERLSKPPEPTEPFVIGVLTDACAEFAERFLQARAVSTAAADAENIMLQLLRGRQNAVREYELFNMAWRIARKHSLDIRAHLTHVDFGALTFQQKRALVSTIGNNGLDRWDELALKNSMIRSDLVSVVDLTKRQLDRSFNLQRLYSSKIHGLPVFFAYLKRAMQEFRRKVILFKTDDRFVIAVFIRCEIKWGNDVEEDEEDDIVGDDVVVCSFLPQGSSTLSTLRPCTVDYRVHCSNGNFQLYNKNKANTFIFLARPARGSEQDLIMSVALQNISRDVQRQIGRVNRTPIIGIEIHVVSNRDQVAHQIFDQWFEHVPTEIYTKRFERETTTYKPASISDIDWELKPAWLKHCFIPKHASSNTLLQYLAARSLTDLELVMECSLEHNSHEELFWVFDLLLSQLPGSLVEECISKWMERHPPLAFSILKQYPPDEEARALPTIVTLFVHEICRNVVCSANVLGIATLVALEKIAANIARLALKDYLNLLMTAANCIRSRTLVQEILLVLHECRTTADQQHLLSYVHKHALGVAFERAEEAADECPCDEDGRPGKQRIAPAIVKLFPIPDKPSTHIKAHIRIDARSAARLHSVVRLQSASHTEPRSAWHEGFILDGRVVLAAVKGEMTIELYFPPPPEMGSIDWKLYDTGSVATSEAMMEALLRLQEKEEACQFFDILIMPLSVQNIAEAETESLDEDTAAATQPDKDLNTSQNRAVHALDSSMLSLIWGPPGTGKTTVVIKILRKILKESSKDIKILMTASTHNAVDNVLARFIKLNQEQSLVSEESILRVATNQAKVQGSLQSYTIDARVGGDMNEDNKLFKKAKQRVETARIIFTTCAGAGLGILRNFNEFDVAIIDEASQITEPVALIPLVKGVRRAILVGDHVQLRPTVRPMAKALEFDVSLLERLYTAGRTARMSRVMLDVQYRFPKSLALFPSTEFYQGKLKTGTSAVPLSDLFATCSNFPWPLDEGTRKTSSLAIFVQCAAEEDMGGRSKSNSGQADLVAKIIPLLTQAREKTSEKIVEELKRLEVTVLTPYTKQVAAIKSRCPRNACSTVDSFQGRETDIVVFSSVRCNAEGDVGFVEDARRLNVMWTRARLALIIVGDRRTLSEKSGIWKRAIESCVEVAFPV